MTVGILGVAPIKIPDFDTEETARTQESSASGSTQESSAPGPQLAGSMSRTRTWVSVGVDAGFSELLETSPPSSLTLATSGSFSPRNVGYRYHYVRTLVRLGNHNSNLGVWQIENMRRVKIRKFMKQNQTAISIQRTNPWTKN